MFYYIKFYTKYLIWIFIILFLCALAYGISKFDAEVQLSAFDYTLYAKQNVIIFAILGFYYLTFKVFGIMLSLNSYFITFKYRFLERFETAKSFFHIKQKTKADIIKEILFMKRKKLYKSALTLTAGNYVLSDKILFWHLFFLLKLGKRREFMRIFTSMPNGRAIKLFTNVYLKNKLFKIFKIRNLYFTSPDNQVFTYIYANSLFSRGKVKKSQMVLMNFLNNKQILMTDIYCSYLMNVLAIKIERRLNNCSASDFIMNYKENIENYHESQKRF